MAQTCTKCSRNNPADASYCYYDGSLLEGHSQNGGAVRGLQAFPSQFVFPNGLICRNFDQLAQACQENWSAAVDLLQQGYLENFLGGLGRADLAIAAREASRFPDRDRGLDQLLAKLPSQVLEAPKLKVEPREVSLGVMEVGTNRQLELHLDNQGARLLYGSVTSDDCPWLTLGDAPGTPSKVFQFGADLVIAMQVRGANLRAGNKPLEGKLVIESNGGNSVVTVRCEVPVKPFPEGVLAGAKSPRQIAEKAKAAPKEAALLFEKGAVADWYKLNGWTYPVQGPSAAGLGAVQQFFEALGLTAPPKVDINERFINFHGDVGQKNLTHPIEVKAQEKRPVFAHAVSDQPWLVPERAHLNGRTAIINITVPAVPNRPGEVLQGRVTITSNGNQRFVVPVTLNVSGTFAEPIMMPAHGTPHVMEPVFANLAAPSPVMAAPLITGTAVPGRAPRPATMQGDFAPMPIPVAAEPIVYRRSSAGRKKPLWVHLLPIFLIAAGVVVTIILDFLLQATVDADYPVYPELKVAVGFLDDFIEIDKKRDESLGGESLRFGFYLPDVDDQKTLENPLGKKRLTYFPQGTSNNTCLRIDGVETLLGSTRRGGWTKKGKLTTGTARDGANNSKEDRFGRARRSVFKYAEEKVQITQIVEVIPNEQPTEVSYKGKKQDMRLLDTVLVRYVVENLDDTKHKVGLRYLLDTFIGSNDGVPFTIPGKGLCNTKHEFVGKGIPQYIQALEKEDLENPGTVAHLALRVAGLDAPDRVTLGAWPHGALKDLDKRAKGHMTMWDVPFLEMNAGGRKDSAVTMYWNERPLNPKEKREVGFAYGRGSFEGGGGKIGLSMGGDFFVGGEFTVTAEISDPRPGEKATIHLPDNFKLVEGEATQDVPAAEQGTNRGVVTWKITSSVTGRKNIKVTVTPSGSQSKPVNIKSKAGIFG
jgi:hypothetical protein